MRTSHSARPTTSNVAHHTISGPKELIDVLHRVQNLIALGTLNEAQQSSELACILAARFALAPRDQAIITMQHASILRMNKYLLLAETTARRALDLLERSSLEALAEKSCFWLFIAQCNEQADCLPEALTAYENHLILLNRQPEAPLASKVACRFAIANIQSAQGDTARFNLTMFELFNSLHEAKPEDYENLSAVFFDQGLAFYKQHKYQESQMVLIEARRLYQDARKQDLSAEQKSERAKLDSTVNPLFQIGMSLAGCELALGNCSAAEKELRSLLEAEKLAEPVNHENVREIRKALGRVYEQMGFPHKGELFARMNLKEARQNNDPNQLLTALIEVAEECEDNLKLTETEDFLEEAQQMLQPDQHSERLACVRLRSSLLAAAGKLEEASSLLAQEIAAQKSLRGGFKRDLLSSCLTLAQMYYHLERDDGTQELLDEIEAHFAAADDPLHELVTGQCLGIRGKLALKEGDHVRAQEFFQQSLDRLEKDPFGRNSLSVVAQLLSLAGLKHQVGALDESEEKLKQALAILENRGRDSHPLNEMAHRALAEIAFARGDLETAERHELRAASIRTDLGRLNDGKYFGSRDQDIEPEA